MKNKKQTIKKTQPKKQVETVVVQTKTTDEQIKEKAVVNDEFVPKLKFVPKEPKFKDKLIAKPVVIDLEQKRKSEPKYERKQETFSEKVLRFEHLCLTGNFTKEKINQLAHDVFVGHSIEIQSFSTRQVNFVVDGIRVPENGHYRIG